MISFINRDAELYLLEDEWVKEGGKLIILYGRRRIGKTRLLLELTKNKEGIFYIAEDTSAQIQINALKEKISDFLDDPLLNTLEIKDWSQIFEYLAKNQPKKRFYFIIDEFSYLIKSDKRILSVLQKIWDTQFSYSNIFIVLSGSMLGLMSEMVLSYASPLYGRRSKDLLLEGLYFKHAREFVSWSFQEALELYFITGGVPEYLLKASEYDNQRRFLEYEFFDKLGYFYREPYFIISQEFKELKSYFSILNAIASGKTKPTEIANFVGMETRKIYPYLENLIRMGFIKRETPILGDKKKGIYVIKDTVFDFWFNFVFKNREGIERGTFSLQDVDFAGYYGKKFEEFVRDELHHLFNFTRSGRWWYKEEEIDIVAVNDFTEEIGFFECKWRELGRRDVETIVKKLRQKAKLVKWGDENRKEVFGVIAKKIVDKEHLRSSEVLVYDIEDLAHFR